jgi:hypothetical protein
LGEGETLRDGGNPHEQLALREMEAGFLKPSNSHSIKETDAIAVFVIYQKTLTEAYCPPSAFLQ